MSAVYKQITVRVPVEHIEWMDEIVASGLEDDRKAVIQKAIEQALRTSRATTLPDVVHGLLERMYANGLRFHPEQRDDVLAVFNEVIER